VSWRDHPLCAPRDAMPSRFWGPERFDPGAWRELASLIEPDDEIAALAAALAGMHDVDDVGGGTGLLASAFAGLAVTIVEPAAEQRAHLPAAAIAGRAEAIPVPDGGADAAVATWVLQYTDDPRRAVAELARVARRRVVLIQAAPDNELVAIYNREAAIADLPAAHHGWLLALAAQVLEDAGFTVTLARVAIPVRVPDAGDVADMLARLHFANHPRRAEMAEATRPLIGTTLRDDGVVLTATRAG
jgi:SAM-dependent methyltransferase